MEANSKGVLEGYISEIELGRQLGKSLRTLWRWRVRRTGPAYVVVGRVVMYKVTSVREWLDGLERPNSDRHGRRAHRDPIVPAKHRPKRGVSGVEGG